MKTVLLLIVCLVSLVYAAVAKSDKTYWKDRCERVEQGYMDGDCIRILDMHRRTPKLHPGPAIRLYVGLEKDGVA